jgi:hypothetical protein
MMNESDALVKPSSASLAQVRSTPALASGRRYPDIEEWKHILESAKIVWDSGIAEAMQLKNQQQVVTVALKGWELGLPLMASLEGIRIIRGRPQPASALMESLAVARVPGARVDWIELGENGRATCVAHRAGRKPVTITYTEEDARRAKVDEKDTYKQWPAQLYRAGALRQACWLQYKDVYFGFEPPTPDMAVLEDDDGLVNAVETPSTAPTGPPPSSNPPAPVATSSAGSAPAATPPPTVTQRVDTKVDVKASPAAPEDAVLPFKNGDYAGKKLSECNEADYRKLIHGYRTTIARMDPMAPDADAVRKEKEGWLHRVEQWAGYRGFKVPPLQAAPPTV